MFIGVVATGALAGFAYLPYSPSPEETAGLYARSTAVQRSAGGSVLNERLTPVWLGDDVAVRRQETREKATYVRFSYPSGAERPLFDHARVAEALAKESGTQVGQDSIDLGAVTVSAGGTSLRFTFRGKSLELDLATSTVKAATAREPGPTPGQGQPRSVSTDGRFRLRINAGQVEVQETGAESWTIMTQEGQFERATWAPWSNHIVAMRVIPGDRRQVSVLLSTGPNRTRSELRTRFYDQPGDKLDQTEMYLVDAAAKKSLKVGLPPINNGGQPWAGPPGIQWLDQEPGSVPSFAVQEVVRGYQQVRLHRVWVDGRVKTLIDEKSDTFVHVGQFFWRQVGRDRIVFRSERTGWGMLFSLDLATGIETQLTDGQFVVRSLVDVDPSAAGGTLTFTANGKEKGDPYFIDTYRLGLDGKRLVRLTQGEGTHQTQWSPNKNTFLDTSSSQVSAPVHAWRKADGTLIKELAKADVSALTQSGAARPEVFVAKGRDGLTDIWGLIYRPSSIQPGTKYPVIENIYAGPHDSHVAKAWQPFSGDQQLADLGFIVVRIDGMGTANRGKKFHDVCWKNIADAGFPDRIAWIKSAAAKYQEIDAERVGIFGTSAGGQNAAGAVLFHPGFYDVAVASCGCHDNRIDKQWWNEQWMGYPIGPHYEAQSNVTNASKLVGKLMLIVGEVDTNVPPESTYRFVDALQSNRKDFEFVLIPGADHTGGGAYGERKRRDFFVRHLHGIEPPAWESPAAAGHVPLDLSLVASLRGESPLD